MVPDSSASSTAPTTRTASAALLNGELYRLGILIAVVVLIAALALMAGRRRLSSAYRLELDANPAGVARSRTNASPQQSGR